MLENCLPNLWNTVSQIIVEPLLWTAQVRWPHGDAILYEAMYQCQPDDNPSIGIVLGAKKDELLMEYALQDNTNQLFAAKYQLYLPKREELQAQLDLLLDMEE